MMNDGDNQINFPNAAGHQPPLRQRLAEEMFSPTRPKGHPGKDEAAQDSTTDRNHALSLWNNSIFITQLPKRE